MRGGGVVLAVVCVKQGGVMVALSLELCHNLDYRLPRLFHPEPFPSTLNTSTPPPGLRRSTCQLIIIIFQSLLTTFSDEIRTYGHTSIVVTYRFLSYLDIRYDLLREIPVQTKKSTLRITK